MLLGILSDTHDRYEIMGLAVRTLQDRGAEFFIHCGDLCSPRMLDHLAGLKCAFVLGNNDWDRQGIESYAESIHVPFHGHQADLELAGKKLAVLHGDYTSKIDAIVKAQQYDYLFHGHSHLKRDERIGRTRIINPGALQRAVEKTVALLDIASDQLSFIRIA